MSINITVHSNKLESGTHKNVRRDSDEMQKAQFADRRIQRLEQVRQQSKDLASKVRRNVNEEMKKQERRIEEIKQKELLQWREKAIAEAEEQCKKCVKTIGTAHRAALAECQAKEKDRQKQRKQAELASGRGLEALRKEKEKIAEQKKKKPKPKLDVYIPKVSKRKDVENSQNAANVSSKSIAVTSSSESSDEAISKTRTTLKKNKVVVMDVNTDSDSSSVSLQDSHEESNRHFYRTAEKSESTTTTTATTTTSSEKPSYNAVDYKASDSTSDRSNSIESRPPRKFTQISDLVQKRQVASLTSLDLPPGTTTEPSTTPKSCLKAKCTSSSSNKGEIQPNSTTSKTSKTKTEASSNTVQFYDYDGKYSKKYEQKSDVVTTVSRSRDEPSAMESARLELEQLEKDRRAAEELRKKSEERGKRALERERVRKECEELIRKLDTLNRDNDDTLREIDGRGINAFTQTKLKMQEAKRQEKMNEELRKVLERNVVTCPEVNRKPRTEDVRHKKPTVFNVAEIAEKPGAPKDFNMLDSSDSYASILLDYVDKQTEQISHDIQNSDSSETRKELQCLLHEVNELREMIIKELNMHAAKKAATGEMKNIAKSVTNLRKKREEILSEESHRIDRRKAELDRRERRLKEKEQRLQKTIKEMVKGAAVQNEKLIAEKDEVIKHRRTCSPVEIVIKVKNETAEKQPKKHPKKSPRKRSSLIDIKSPKRKKVVVRTTSDCLQQEESHVDGQSARVMKASSITSTAYLSPPDAVTTRLGQLLTSPVAQPDKNKQLVARKVPDPPKGAACLNPVLTHYIQRLLGMSRDSIEMLGVSSSTMETPSSSVVNNSTNLSSPECNSIEKEKLHRLQEFINENYSFISDLEESLKSKQSNSSTSSSEKKTIQKIWQEALRQKKTVQERDEKDLKSILKKKAKSERVRGKSRERISKEASVQETSVKYKDSSQNVTLRSRDTTTKCDKATEVSLLVEQARLQQPPQPADADVLDQKKLQLANKYTELTENCARRITELTEMINKVRKEKQKILEITLTSGSETARTEYLDFAENFGDSAENSSKILDIKPASPDRGVNLEKNKLTGVSRDSGISLSRPLTALDSRRGTPDSRLGFTTPDTHQISILKDLTDAKTYSAGSRTVTIGPPSDEQQLAAKAKGDRPPSAISRFTPALVLEAQRHELSTILEVDTPATSRLNASVTDKNISILSTKLAAEFNEYNEFLTFEDYARKHNIDLDQLEIDASPRPQTDFSTIAANVSHEGTLEYHEFPTLNTYLHTQAKHDQTQTTITTQDLSYRKFPSFKTYAKQQGLELQVSDSQTALTSSISISDPSSSSKSSEAVAAAAASIESSESLPDVVTELKRRNILKHSFRNEVQEIATAYEVGCASPSALPSTSEQAKRMQRKSSSASSSPSKYRSPAKDSPKATPKTSPRKKTKSTPKEDVDDITGIQTLSSTTPPTGSDSLEKELNKMGLGWAARMLKKSQQQSMELSSTSSSFTYEALRKSAQKSKDASKTKPSGDGLQHGADPPQNISDRSEASSTEKPINLKEFLAKELQKLISSQSCSTSTTSTAGTDESIADYFVKSLLEAIGSAQCTNKERTTRDRLLTSTPVIEGGASSESVKGTPHDSTKVFSGESGLSSVRLSSGSSCKRDSINLSKEAARKVKKASPERRNKSHAPS